MDVGVRGRGGAEEWSNGGRGPGWDQGAREGEDQGLRTEEEPREMETEGRGKDGGRTRTRERTTRRPRVCGFRVQSERPERACAHGSACNAVESGRCAAQRGIVGVAWSARGGLLSDRKWKREWKWKWKKRKRDDRR